MTSFLKQLFGHTDTPTFSDAEREKKILYVMERAGIERRIAEAALYSCQWDYETALELLGRVGMRAAR